MLGSAPDACFQTFRGLGVRRWFVDDIRGGRKRSRRPLKCPSGYGRELTVRGWLPGELEASLKGADGSFGVLMCPNGSWNSSWLGLDVFPTRGSGFFGAPRCGVTDHGRVRRLEGEQMEPVLLCKRAKGMRGCRFVLLR